MRCPRAGVAPATPTWSGAVRVVKIAGALHLHQRQCRRGGTRWPQQPPHHDPARDRAGARSPHHRPADGQARGRDRAAQPLAPCAAARRAAQRGDAQEHPDDRPDRRGQDRDRAPPGHAGQRAVREGGGHPLHRGRLRRQGRRADHPRPGRHRGQALPRAGQEEGAYPGRGARRGAHPRRPAAAPKPAAGARLRVRRTATVDIGAEPSSQSRKPAASCASACARRLDDREIELDRPWARHGHHDPPGMEEMGQQLRQMFSSLGGGRPEAQDEHPRRARC